MTTNFFDASLAGSQPFAEKMVEKLDFSGRRNQAFNLIDGGAMLLLSQPTAIRNSDVGHGYRQESSLYYFTGFAEPESALLLTAPKNGKRQQDHVFT